MCQMTITSVYPSQSVSQHIEMNSQVEFFLFPRERERERATQTYQCHIESHRSNKAWGSNRHHHQAKCAPESLARLIAQKAKAHTVAFSCSMACILNRATLQRKWRGQENIDRKRLVWRRNRFNPFNPHNFTQTFSPSRSLFCCCFRTPVHDPFGLA